MPAFYNQLRSLKGTSIGTIIPWAGSIGNVPPGWVICDGRVLNTNDFPELFSVLGYQYGGSSTSFNLPNLKNKALVDFHPSHANIPNLGYNTVNDAEFISRIGENTANETGGRTSNIDLYVNLQPVNSLTASLSGFSLNESFYTGEVVNVPRALGDQHMGSHTHPGTTDSIVPTLEFVETCQSEPGTNCPSLFSCADSCAASDYWPSEQNGNKTWGSFLIPTEPDNANALGYTIRASANQSEPPFFGRNDPNPATYAQWTPNGVWGQMELRDNPSKNYHIQEDDTEVPGANNTGNHPYPIYLNHSGVNWAGNSRNPNGPGSQNNNYPITGHDHGVLGFNINRGNVSLPNLVRSNNVSTGNIAPINSALEGVASFRVDNVSTPSLRILHIIRAY